MTTLSSLTALSLHILALVSMVGLFRRRSSAESSRGPGSVTINDALPHLRSTAFITGAFCTAWAWDLVYYGFSHATAGENPLQDQLSFGNQRAPKHLLDLLLQFLVVCGGAAVLSDYCSSQGAPWSNGAVVAVEFFPSPVFAGKLMAYLGQYSRLGTVKRAVTNLAATWFAASLAHWLPMIHTFDEQHGILQRLRLTRFGAIVQSSLGFGLGIAWNVLLGQFAPEDTSNLNVVHLLGLAGYLMCVSLVAFRLAAVVKAGEDVVTLWDRQLALLSFAFYVVCAFTLVTFLNALLHPGWIGALESLAVLLLLSAAMSAMVAHVDFDSITDEPQEGDEQKLNLMRGPCGIIMFLPCVWFCCPWIPLAWILAGTSETVHVKEHWFQLIAMVSGLASSIDASGMLTSATDAIATSLGICNIAKCRHPWLFVLLQVLLAVLVSVVLIPLIASLGPEVDNREHQEERQEGTERQPLLRRIRKKLFSRKSSLREDGRRRASPVRTSDLS